METYSEFLCRINSFENKKIDFGSMPFTVNSSLAKKVGEDNTFRNFYGDTVVFALDKATKDRLTEYADVIFRAASECFCERLIPNTFHITLHDLSNAPVLRTVAEELFDNELKVVEKKSEIQKLEIRKIKFKSKFIFNMVNTSLVLGLYPVDENEYDKIMKLYNIIDGVKKLPYPLTPHITLGYYNVHGFGVQSARALEKAVNDINNGIDFAICTDGLIYQKFKSMNEYIDIIDLI